jgi:molybdenum cofactor cytidylyltransferase
LEGRVEDVVTAERLAALLAHPKGGLKRVPGGARVRVLLNKADTPERVQAAHRVFHRLLQERVIDAVAIGAVVDDPPVRGVHGRIAGVILAAGGSGRFGETKQLLPWRGTTLVGHTVDVALASGLWRVFVVVGYDGERVAAALAGRDVEVVFNPDWVQGQSTSLRAGIEAVGTGVEGAVFFVADQPNLTPDLVRAVTLRHRQTLAPIVVPAHGARRGNPALFDRDLFPELMRIGGDRGGRALMEKYQGETEIVEVDDGAVFDDVDTVADYQRLTCHKGRATSTE